MWPKMLFELLPHFARLVPLADKFFVTRSTSERAQESALAAISEEFRGGRGQVAEMQAAIDRALQTQGAQIADIGIEITRTRMGVDSLEHRVAKLENTAALGMRLLGVALLLIASTLGLLVLILVHLSSR